MQNLGFLFALTSFLCKAVVEALFFTSMDEKDIASKWDLCYRELVRFRMNHGHCSPHRKKSGNERQGLGLWVMSQRNALRSGRLEKYKMDKLVALGFVWSPRTEVWNRMYIILKQFVLANGHCDVAAAENGGLARWISTQRFRQAPIKKM